MRDDPLATYMQDHLGGAAAALEILAMLRDQHAGESVGEFAAQLAAEVESDRAMLETLAAQVGNGSSVLKDAAGWLGAKASRLKLGRRTTGDLGTFQALETLALGILGKLALWQALTVIAPADRRLAGVDLRALAARAETQHARVEAKRLGLARAALGGGAP
jgi:hypothetical protein